jgi:DDE superfamily endonuclease
VVVVANKNRALQNCVSFIDGTKIEIARPPGVMQPATYSGHKRVNCLKYQLISAPDNLALHYAGPVEGRRHDMAIYSASGIEEDLASSLHIDGIQYCIYGDSAYALREYLMVGFDGTVISPEQAAFNKAMSRSRVTVEWTFKDIKNTGITQLTRESLRCAGLLLGFRMEPALFFGTSAAACKDRLPHASSRAHLQLQVTTSAFWTAD